MTETEQQDKVLLPLDAPRSIALRVNQKLLTWHFRRVTQPDWQKFFDGIVNRTLRHNGVEERVFESDTALLELVDRTLSSVHGYDFDATAADWKAALPIQHKVTVGVVLRAVACETAVDDLVLGPHIDVRLTSSWSMEKQTGRMTTYSGLVHRFRHPSIEQMREFNFETSRTRILGTGQDGVTVYPNRQSVAMRLYDQLIDSVEGYAAKGEPLTGIEAIRSEMDAMHKATAAMQLFSPSQSIEIP
ncbi:MAG TPA: hypothetical protein VHX37_13530 [Acidobacteriaceae bacterium]|jgi:hypothetical protein|nr:hypothetical protein [Acidobacteriaceae bacterium]